MGIFSRLSDVINSNIHAMLDRAEDPEKMVRLIIQEMEDTLVEVRSSAVSGLARRKELQRALAQLDAESGDWESKAELAMRHAREDLARGALAVRQGVLARRSAAAGELERAEVEIAKLDEDTAKLKAKLADARQRQQSILLRQRAVSSRLRVKEQIDDRKLAGAMARMEQYEGRIDRMEAELEAYDLGSRELADEVAQLESDDRVEAELERLRAKLGRSAAVGPKPVPSAS
jgi:phage shock protein A